MLETVVSLISSLYTELFQHILNHPIFIGGRKPCPDTSHVPPNVMRQALELMEDRRDPTLLERLLKQPIGIIRENRWASELAVRYGLLDENGRRTPG